MKIAVLWNFNQAKEIFPNWRDGHRAALEEVAKHHDVWWLFGEETRDIPDGFDFLLFWTDSNDPILHEYSLYPAKKGIILTSDNNFNPATLLDMDVVYCESVPVLEKVKRYGIHGIQAMGTDTDFYSPNGVIKKDIQYFYPATFSPWKRQSEIAYLGERLWCVGTIQPDGQDEFRACQEKGVNLKIGYFPAEEIRDFYRRAGKVIIPAIHGSERTLLEAMSMNILPVVLNADKNARLASYIEEYMLAKKQDKNLTPRDFILARYSHKVFAERLLEGIENDS